MMIRLLKLIFINPYDIFNLVGKKRLNKINNFMNALDRL